VVLALKDTTMFALFTDEVVGVLAGGSAARQHPHHPQS